MAAQRRTNECIYLLVMLTILLEGCSSYEHRTAEAAVITAVPTALPTTKVVVTEVPPTAVPQPTETPLVMTYRSILMLERAADLIIAYLGEIRSGSINYTDSAARQAYSSAFPIAIKTYNETVPPAQLSAEWMNISSIAVEYNKVYSLIQQGKPVAVADYYNLKAFRNILSKEQVSLEASLSNYGMSSDFFNNEKQSVDQQLQQEYCDTPLPTIIP